MTVTETRVVVVAVMMVVVVGLAVVRACVRVCVVSPGRLLALGAL